MSLNQLPDATNRHVIRYKAFITSRPQTLYGGHLHHILPKCMGGTDEEENLIRLSLREHYIAHLILWKAYGGKLARAFWIMSNGMSLKNGRVYENLKKDLKLSEDTKSKMSKSHQGMKPSTPAETLVRVGKENYEKYLRPFLDKNGPVRKGAVQSEEVKQKISEALRGKERSLEHRLHLSESLKGKPTHRHTKGFEGHHLSEASKKRISESIKGRHHTDESKLKMSLAAKKREENKRRKREENN